MHINTTKRDLLAKFRVNNCTTMREKLRHPYGSPRVWSKMNGNKEYPRKAAGKQINPVGGTADYVPENG